MEAADFMLCSLNGRIYGLAYSVGDPIIEASHNANLNFEKLPIDARIDFIGGSNLEYSTRQQRDLLSVSPSSYYNIPVGIILKNMRLTASSGRIITRYPCPFHPGTGRHFLKYDQI
ncbi:MAG: hypothetical protein LBO05_05285 [Deltaproteobacteria bacterium]|jgi:hypothetical protein|nr:hypothetical protein [Deltaproteobacteria bacterium]